MENFDIVTALAYLQEIMEKEDKEEVLRLIKEKLGDDVPLSEEDLKGPLSKDRVMMLAQSIKGKLPESQQQQLDMILQMFFG